MTTKSPATLVTGPDGDNPITDEQIRQLAIETDDIRVATDCAGALLPGAGRRATRELIRARCAAAWNARHGGG